MILLTQQELTDLVGKEKAEEIAAKQVADGYFEPVNDCILVEVFEESKLTLSGILKTVKETKEVRRVKVLAKGENVSDAVEIGTTYAIAKNTTIKEVPYKGEKLSLIHENYLLGKITNN